MLHDLCYTRYFVFVNFYVNSVIINNKQKNKAETSSALYIKKSVSHTRRTENVLNLVFYKVLNIFSCRAKVASRVENLR